MIKLIVADNYSKEIITNPYWVLGNPEKEELFHNSNQMGCWEDINLSISLNMFKKYLKILEIH